MSYPQNTSTETFVDICCADSQYVYVSASQGSIFKTSNGGQSWIVLSKNFGERINNITFCSRDTGFVTKYYSYILFRTTNGGETWEPLIQFDREIKDLEFINSNVGFTVGVENERNIYKTTDGGKNWIGYYSGSNQFTGTKLSIVDPQVIYVCNWWFTLKKSIDAGLSWDYSVTIPPVILSVNDVKFITRELGFIYGSGVDENGSGNFCYLVRTLDSGENWDYLYAKENSWITDIFFINKDKGWICAEEGIHSTTNGFETETIINIPIQKFDFLNENIAYGISNDKIYKTYDGWTTSDSLYSIVTNIDSKSLINKKFILSQNYPNPFNSSTKIDFTLSENGQVELIIYDIRGRELEVLTSKYYLKGRHTLSWDAGFYPSGIYYYKLNTGSDSVVKKLILIK